MFTLITRYPTGVYHVTIIYPHPVYVNTMFIFTHAITHAKSTGL